MRILLVDDEVELEDSLAQLFTREGYRVDVAYDGGSALEILRDRSPDLTQLPYDLLVLDWMLPGQSGLEICREIRAAGSGTPVLFLTAKDTLDDRVEGLDAGADDYLVKPFELRELLARVRAQLRRAAVATVEVVSGDRLLVQGLELDRDNRVAYRDGSAISLSDKEFRLLDYFMTHPGQLLTREQIYQHLWPEGEQPSSNVLAAQVKLLRKKIGSGDPAITIHSVYGKGYRFGEKPT